MCVKKREVRTVNVMGHKRMVETFSLLSLLTPVTSPNLSVLEGTCISLHETPTEIRQRTHS